MTNYLIRFRWTDKDTRGRVDNKIHTTTRMAEDEEQARRLFKRYNPVEIVSIEEVYARGDK